MSNYLKYVNILQGTKSVPHFSHGNTLPLTQLPFGMVSFAPQTDSSSERWFFHSDDHRLEGIRLTHQPSPWIGDYGCLTFLPQSGEPMHEAGNRWSGYRQSEAELAPNYLKVGFLKYRSVMEITPTERGAAFRISYGDAKKHWLSILAVGGNCTYKLEGNTLHASTDYHMAGVAENFRMYMTLIFDNGIDTEGTKVVDKDGNAASGCEIAGEKAGIHVAVNETEITGRLAISYVSFEQADLTLSQENAVDFEAVREAGKNLWESYLSRIEVECETEEQMKTFYTCMWRGFLFPHKCYEIDQDGNPIHYAPCTGKTLPGVRYTDNGFWDTYRTVYPFYSLVAKEEYKEMLEGFIGDYTEGGWLPRWLSIGEVGCMPSTLIDAVIADAAVKGIIGGELLETALEGMIHHATTDSEDKRFGRNGAEAYCKYGYVPYDLEHESVNLTLDAAYGDFCIAEVARILGKTEIEEKYRVRAKNYANIFDKETGFMRARNTEGTLRENFSPISWGLDYTEAAAWQTTFAVPHDLEGLAELMGGREAILKKLDELFAEAPHYEDGGYGCEIHEMTEFAANDFGQCAINNQPSFHLPYLFAYFGEQEKTNYWVKKICDEVMTSEPDGFPGDEDNGTMALWYVFSALGLYPVCPGKKEFVKGIMLVKSAKILGRPWSNEKFGSIIPFDEV
ncbi:MAG: GH92 family glycosyl hydrolase [Clostridiales bacterium]|nr:GH92 family glycosyl hydrolase [Clostridiales bacterium]